MYRYYKFVRFEGERACYRSENCPEGKWDLSIHKNALDCYHEQQNLPRPPSLERQSELEESIDELRHLHIGDTIVFSRGRMRSTIKVLDIYLGIYDIIDIETIIEIESVHEMGEHTAEPMIGQETLKGLRKSVILCIEEGGAVEQVSKLKES